MITEILNELNQENGSNYKIDTLKKHKDNILLKDVLSKAFDKTKWQFNITNKNIPKVQEYKGILSLEDALKEIEKFHFREISGNDAISKLHELLTNLNEDDADVLRKVIDRDLRINMGRTNINKAIPNLIHKQLYAGCKALTFNKIVAKIDTKSKIYKTLLPYTLNEKNDSCRVIITDKISSIGFDVKDILVIEKAFKDYPKGEYSPMDLLGTKLEKGTINKINFKNALVQLKADGSYREINITNNKVEFLSRSGKAYSYPLLEKALEKLNDCYLIGELTVFLDDELLESILPKIKKLDKKNSTNKAQEIQDAYQKSKDENREYILDRAIGNGLLNSDDIPNKNIIVDLWDKVSNDDYLLASLKDKKNLPKEDYKARFNNLKETIKEIYNPNIRLIEYQEITSIQEALKFASQKMKDGFEGAILKDYSMLFKDGRSNLQLKIKLKIEGEFRIVGFKEGKANTSRAKTFGSLEFVTDCGFVEGYVSSRLTDDLIEKIHADRESYLGKIMTLGFNDLTKSRDSEIYALSHPIFIEFRDDRTETDTIEKLKEEMAFAMML